MLYALGGECLKLMGRNEETVACWEKALALDPGQCEAQSALGFYYEEQGLYEQAHAVWRAMEQRLESVGCDAERQIANRRAQRCLEKMQGA